MELMISYFWVIKLTLIIITLFIVYKAIVIHKFKNKMWNILTVTIVLFNIIQPIKIQPTTVNVVKQQDKLIEQSIIIPPMQLDTSFKQNANIQGITQNDLK